jgi:hypothetical protein
MLANGSAPGISFSISPRKCYTVTNKKEEYYVQRYETNQTVIT